MPCALGEVCSRVEVRSMRKSALGDGGGDEREAKMVARMTMEVTA
ncbi:MAG: hypothetical protein R3B46_06050 [Phycisphaerales bacterium]